MKEARCHPNDASGSRPRPFDSSGRHPRILARPNTQLVAISAPPAKHVPQFGDGDGMIVAARHLRDTLLVHHIITVIRAERVEHLG